MTATATATIAKRACLRCGRLFAPTRPNRQYCCARCGDLYRKALARERPRPAPSPPRPSREHTCVTCGQTFMSSSNSAKYCPTHQGYQRVEHGYCLVCGAKIVRASATRYCSPTCMKRGDQIRKRQGAARPVPLSALAAAGKIPVKPPFPGPHAPCPRCKARQWHAEPEVGLFMVGIEYVCLPCGERPWALVPTERRRTMG